MPSRNYQSIVVLTGAGISAESGIRTFRASEGLWEDHRIEDVASPEGFSRDPETVHRFYNMRRDQLIHQGVKPNPAHLALAEFEQQMTHCSGEPALKTFTLITQNIDDLHERAGSINLFHMHGELLKMRCRESNQVFPCREDTFPGSLCPCCSKPGNLRPHVVWFGEMPLFMEEIYRALEQCDLFVAIGTSGNVYPAAGFFETAKAAGAHTVELNLEPSVHGSRFDEQVNGPASEVVPWFLNSLGPTHS